MGGFQMKDVFDMVSDIRSLVNVPELTSLIDGKVYSSIRPDGSKMVDVVVNGLHITQTYDQIGSGNINIYVPKKDFGDGRMETDQARMSSLGKIVSGLIKCVYASTFRVFLDEQAKPVKDADGNYYVNIRYKYYSIQNEQVEI
jgi:hypothetical protein